MFSRAIGFHAVLWTLKRQIIVPSFVDYLCLPQLQRQIKNMVFFYLMTEFSLTFQWNKIVEYILVQSSAFLSVPLHTKLVFI